MGGTPCSMGDGGRAKSPPGRVHGRHALFRVHGRNALGRGIVNGGRSSPDQGERAPANGGGGITAAQLASGSDACFCLIFLRAVRVGKGMIGKI